MNDNEIDLSALDPARNGTLDTLQRIEKNTEELAKNIAREATANIRTLRRMQSRQPAGQREPLVPGATVAPIPEADTRARVTRRRATASPDPVEQAQPEPATVAPERVAPARGRTRTRAPRQTEPASTEATQPRTASPEPVGQSEPADQPEQRQPGRTRQQRQTQPEAAAGDDAAQSERETPQRGANGRFQSRAEQALQERQQEQQERDRTKTLAEALRDGVADVAGLAGDNGDAQDAIGNSVGGPIYGAAKELKGAFDDLTDEESTSGKLIRKGLEKVRKGGDRERTAEAEQHAETLDAAEQDRLAVEEVRQGTGEIADAVDAQTQEQRRQHREQMDALDRVSESAANGGGGTSVIGGLGGALGGAAGKVGGFLKGAGGKLLGGLGAVLAGGFAYSAKANELAGREDLTESQKTAQAVSTGVGAAGGGLAGAAAGAATGAAIGSVIPGAGTLIGGIAGSIIGGIAGAWGGEKLGEAVGEAVSGTMDSVEEEAAKILEDRESEIERQATQGPDGGKSWWNPLTWFGGDKPKPVVENRGRSSAHPSLRGTDAEILASDNLGRVSEKYESGGRGVATISTGVGDAGGVSYGKHQLSTSFGMPAFLKSEEGAAYRDRFAGMQAGSAQFNEAYKQVVAEDADGFADAQHAFIKRTHFDPVAGYAKAKGIDVNDPAIQEALWSQSVQHGGKGNRKIIDDAVSRAGEGASSEQVINALYDARTDYASQYASRAATTDRYNRERQDVLAIARQEAAKQAPGTEPGEQVAQGGLVKPGGDGAGVYVRPEADAPAVGSYTGAPPAALATASPTAPMQPVAAVAAAAMAAPADAVVPMQTPAPLRQNAEQARQPAQQASLDPRTIGAEIAKAVTAAMGQGSEKSEPAKSEAAKKGQDAVASTVPMDFDDTLMMLLAHDRV